MSYGTSGSTSGTIKLLAILAGGFMVMLMGCLVWLWFLTRVSLPDDAVAWAVLPAQTVLSSEAPALWTDALDHNAPLPTLLGYAKDAKTGNVEPYAVLFPSIIGGDLFRSSSWPLAYKGSGNASFVGSPFRVFGWPWQATALDSVKLTVLPRAILGGDRSQSFALPEKISGDVIGRTWYTDLPSDIEAMSSIGLNASLGAKNIVSIKSKDAHPLENYYAYQGIPLVLPTSSWLTWVIGTDFVETQLIPDVVTGTDQLMGLAQAKGFYDSVNYILPDQTLVTGMRSPTFEENTSTQPNFLNQPLLNRFLNYIYIDNASPESPVGQTCPGTRVSKFDSASVSNICSWLGMCYFKPTEISVMQENNRVIFCF